MELSSKGLQIGRRIRNMGRLAQITNVFARHGLWSVMERLGVRSELTPEQVRKAEVLSQDVKIPHGLAARIRLSVEELGPAFVKLAQILATREDLLPKDYIEELSRLHSHVPPLSFAEIKKVLKQELGEEKLEAFAQIEETPVAAGSIAQVHEAHLKSGERVAIKVQRPGIDQLIRVDLSLMHELATMLEKYIPETRFARPRAMVAELNRVLLTELDFIREGGNIEKTRRNFSAKKEIVLPEVYWKLTTPRVLTQTFMDGLPVSDKALLIEEGIDPSKLVERGLTMFFKMVFIDGLYHGDLHPGNLMALPESRVGVIDFGLCVHVSRSLRENLAGLLVSLVNEDYERAVLHYIEMADPDVTFDAVVFEHEFGNAVAPFVGLKLEEVKSSSMFWEVAKVAARHGAPMPQELIVFVKTLTSFEGLGAKLDPSFDVLRVAEKFTAEISSEIYSVEQLKHRALLVARDVGELAKHAPFQIRRLLKAALEGDLRLTLHNEDAAALATAIDRSSARLAVAVVIASLIIGASILVFAHVGRELFSLSVFGLVGFGLAGLLGIYMIWSILRGQK